MSAAAPPILQVNPSLFLPFVQATRNVLEMMAQVNSTIGKPFRKLPPYPTSEVSGVINLFGDVLGTVVINMPRGTAMHLVQALTGAAVRLESAEFADAVGELANMIVGSAKKDLGVEASITLPTVIVSNGHCIPALGTVPCIVIPCTSSKGDFAIEVSIKVLKESAK